MGNGSSTCTRSQHIMTLQQWLEVSLGLLPCRELPRSQTRSWAANTGTFFALDQQSPRAEGNRVPRGHPVPMMAGASLSKNRLGDVCAVLLPLHIPSLAHMSWWEDTGSGRLCRPSALPHCMWGGHRSGSLVQAGCCLGDHLMASSPSSSHSCWKHICHGRCNLFHAGLFQQTLRTGLESHPCSPLIIEP